MTSIYCGGCLVCFNDISEMFFASLDELTEGDCQRLACELGTSCRSVQNWKYSRKHPANPEHLFQTIAWVQSQRGLDTSYQLPVNPTYVAGWDQRRDGWLKSFLRWLTRREPRF